MQIATISLYDPDIHKIPEYNWQKFQRCLIMDSGIGSTLTAILARADNIALYASKQRSDDLINELNNFKLSLYSAVEGLNYTSMAFACLVQNIAGKTYPIVTDTDIHNLSKLIAGTQISHGEIAEYVDLVKKKLIAN